MTGRFQSIHIKIAGLANNDMRYPWRISKNFFITLSKHIKATIMCHFLQLKWYQVDLKARIRPLLQQGFRHPQGPLHNALRYFILHTILETAKDNADKFSAIIRQVKLIIMPPRDEMNWVVSFCLFQRHFGLTTCQDHYTLVRDRFEPMTLQLQVNNPTITPPHTF